MYGWGSVPSIGWFNWGNPNAKAPGRTANFPKRTSATFLKKGHPEKRCAIKKWTHCLRILLMLLARGLRELKITTTLRP